jgi:DNA-binding NtrC family response regulator
MASDILVVDDEADIRELVAGILTDEGHGVRTAADAEQALAAIRARKPALLVLDIWMQGGGMDGLELLDMIKALDPDLPVVMISGHGNIETAVSAIKRGAYEFLEKPFKSDRLLMVVERALESANLKRENRRLRAQSLSPDGLIGRSSAAQALRQGQERRMARDHHFCPRKQEQIHQTPEYRLPVAVHIKGVGAPLGIGNQTIPVPRRAQFFGHRRFGQRHTMRQLGKPLEHLVRI